MNARSTSACGADGASATALQPPPHLFTTLPAPAGGGRRVCHGRSGLTRRASGPAGRFPAVTPSTRIRGAGRRTRTASFRSRRRWWGCGSRRRPGAAGVERVTAHSGRVGLASELHEPGASTTDVMLAGNWKTSRMVAHYSAGATAERGAVARYL